MRNVRVVMTAPACLRAFCDQTLPVLQRRASGTRAMRWVRGIQQIDRWVSFDRFKDSAAHIAGEYEKLGADVSIYNIPTGGAVGSGRWIIPEATDIRTMTLDMLRPQRQRIADHRHNPFHAVQWTTGTDDAGVRGELLIIDSLKQLDSLDAAQVRGRIVLSRANPRDLRTRLVAKGAAALVLDPQVPNHPDAVAWQKFGWGGLRLDTASSRLVGMVIAHNTGKRLRKLAATQCVELHLRADVRHYQGAHDMVDARIAGADAAEDELWVLAHSIEPGAQDNASGVATCLEITRVIESLVASGAIPRPRRSIRMLHGYECYSFFHYLEHGKAKYGNPVAGLVIDGVGALPSTCNGRLEWRESIESSAGFVDDVGEVVMRAAMRIDDAGYRFFHGPFVATSDTLIGDPQFGFPTPWVSSCIQQAKRTSLGRLYDQYHSSADTMAIMHPPGLRLAAASMAGYLCFLANLDNAQTADLARAQAARDQHRIAHADSARVKRYRQDRAAMNVRALERFITSSGRGAAVRALRAAAPLSPAAGRGSAAASRVPRRIAPLSPTMENTPAPIAARLAKTKLKDWALFWADGRRTLRDIADRLSVEMNQSVTPRQVEAYFDAMADLGYVTWTRRRPRRRK